MFVNSNRLWGCVVYLRPSMNPVCLSVLVGPRPSVPQSLAPDAGEETATNAGGAALDATGAIRPTQPRGRRL